MPITHHRRRSVGQADRALKAKNARDLARDLRTSFSKAMYAFVVAIVGAALLFARWRRMGRAGQPPGRRHCVGMQVIVYHHGRDHESCFRTRTDAESVLRGAPAEVTNFVNRIVRGRNAASSRISARRTPTLQVCSRTVLQAPWLRRRRYPLGYRQKAQDIGKCVTYCRTRK